MSVGWIKKRAKKREKEEDEYEEREREIEELTSCHCYCCECHTFFGHFNLDTLRFALSLKKILVQVYNGLDNSTTQYLTEQRQQQHRLTNVKKSV